MTRLDDLDKLIPMFAQNKSEMESYKKLCDKQNSEIKRLMKDYAIQNYKSGGYKAVYTISKRETMNEEKLLEIAHMYGIPEIVKTKEYIDFDILEKAIYDGKLSPEVLTAMNGAKESKEVITLRVSKIEKENNSNER